jgi:hypothetical protein
MKYAIIGGRNFNDYELLKQSLNEYNDIDLIVSGAANGADELSEVYAKENNIPTLIHKANWKNMKEPCVRKSNQYGEYNSLAGLNRNSLIIKDCDIVIAFWDGKSRGTKDSINKAKKAGKEIIIVKY